MKAVIIEDELKNKEILETLINEYCNDIEIIGSASSVEDAIELIDKVQPDIAFLDIEIEHGSSFEVLNAIKNLNLACIFTTAYNHYAIKAFKYNACDYLLKPINIDELVAATEKAKKVIATNQNTNQLLHLLDTIKKKNSDFQKIALHNNIELEFVEIKDIMYIEAEGSYSVFNLNTNKKIVSTKNIKEYEVMLNENQFCRIHNSFIINLNFIQKYIKGRGGYVIMENGIKIEVSTRKRNDFLCKF